MQISFAVPEVTTTRYLVTVDRAPDDPSAVVPWRIPHPHRREAAAALGTDRLTIVWHPPSHVAVASTAPPAAQPRAALVARAAARAIADAYDGVVTDAITGRIVAADPAPSPAEGTLALTDDWLGWRVETRAAPPSHRRPPACAAPPPGLRGDPARSARTRGPADRAAAPGAGRGDEARATGGRACARGPRWSVTTRGLCRFGLPELMLASDAWAPGRHPFDFLRAAAQRLLDDHLAWLADHPAGGVRTMCGHLRIDGRRCAARRPGHRGVHRLPHPAPVPGAAVRAHGHRRSAAAPIAAPPWRYALVRLALVRVPPGEPFGHPATRADAARVPRWEASLPSDPWHMERSERESPWAEASGAPARKEAPWHVAAPEIRPAQAFPEWPPCGTPAEAAPADVPRGARAPKAGPAVQVLRIRPPVTFGDDPGGAPCLACAGAPPLRQDLRGRAA